jgi:hypothetical protein
LALPFAVKAPNAAARDAIAELETGQGALFRSGAALRVTCMRTIERAGRFKRDYKREARGERREARGQRPEARDQRPEARGKRPEARG